MDLFIGRDVIKHSLKYVKGSTLDYGSGIGKYRNYIEPIAEKYSTFDYSPQSGADILGQAQSSPYEDCSFDTLFCTQVLEHVEAPWKVVNEMFRILRPGGYCIVTAPFCIPYHEDPQDLFRYTRQGLCWLLKDSGFEIIESGAYGGFFVTISEFVRFSFFNPYRPQRRGEFRLMSMIQSMAIFFDRRSLNPKIYPNSYVIAKKEGGSPISA